MGQERGRHVADSVRQRLMNLRESTGEEYNALLTQFAIERFLYRLSQSAVSEQFVLKGAMLFRVWSGTLHRPTKDLDLLGHGEPSATAIAKVVRQVLRTPVADDGLVFDPDSAFAEDVRDAQEYGGIRVKVLAMLGTARIPLQVDIGFGDAVTPEAAVGEYPTLLEMDAPHLRMYPPETVVAEKLQAAVALGMVNTRMKDFYDLRLILRTHDLTDGGLADAVAATFQRRQTALPGKVPPGLSEAFGTDEGARQLWREFLRRMAIEDAPEEFSEVLIELRERLWPVIEQARQR